jgi:hypothetical protein
MRGGGLDTLSIVHSPGRMGGTKEGYPNTQWGGGRCDRPGTSLQRGAGAICAHLIEHHVTCTV